MIKSTVSMKNAVALFFVMLLLTLALATPSSAASYNYQFLDDNENYSAHASSFIVGDAIFNGGSTVTITLEDATILGDLLVWDGSSFVAADRAVDGDGNVQFTFDIANLDNLEIQLYVNAGPHSGFMTLFIEWL
ncbi:hypothetical protein [Halalkalibacter hemicellulosilyticus]|uniref:Uncharacterized protein n=1 Tax=Halalkalibacter hemicellulosilyticusJCM 9152 TaxID=1236971 RepID=W4QDE4_9BACI|nr:hypothetical protein [Halalkalibacter hemicellulosilyticus]GAE29708.1 hypothetical protein JCM9152_1085 [Halalkalibacter hemicellulosilyticusJCM 9152]